MIFDRKEYPSVQHKKFLIKIKETENEEVASNFQTVMDVMFTQMKAEGGIKHFRKVKIVGMIKYFKELDEVVVPGKPVAIPTVTERLT